MSSKPAIHCIRFDDRAVGIMLEPDGGYEDEAFANHALAISAATTQILRVAREIADRSFPEGVDPEAGQKLSGLLVGAEILGSMLEALSHDMAVNARQERPAPNRMRRA